ncbi:putative nucleotidyltransferase-like protein [Pseudoduganella lurida]|uniref:Putative nucleotidyltransferase-like protein n=1 Tax=Pseudoduganella lurida TaxID=1036180 RepID=A0A562R1Q6_9BURK|nr:nucleotidyltransferase family protein [Pseudoduganella lurida]TWI62999.1 putative nucleotidyltransferase-like protein [Pseudoduganella lurida]
MKPGRTCPLLLAALRDPQGLPSLDDAGWDLLLRQAASAHLLATLHGIVEDAGLLEGIPPPAREQLDWAHMVARRHARGVHWEVRQIRQALAGLDVPLTLLKGAAYTLARLPPAAGRLYADIDVLVPEEHLGVAEAALMLAGWAGTHHDAYDQRYYRQWMHELPPLRHVRRASTIDVHHAILPKTAALRPDPVLLRTAAVPVHGEPGLYVLAPVDMVLHSAAHLFCDGEFDHGLRDLLDLHRLLCHFGTDRRFWVSLAPRARVLDLERPLFYALRYTVALLGTPVPAAVSADVPGPRPMLLALMDWLFHRALLPEHASCGDRFSSVARGLLYLRGNWLRMPPLLLARHLLHKAFLSPRKAGPDTA